MTNLDTDAKIRTAHAVSSGTMATLTGRNRYDELDAIRADWYNWIRSHPDFRAQHWGQLWEGFAASTFYRQVSAR